MVSYRTWENSIAAKVQARALRIETYRAGPHGLVGAKATNMENGQTWEWSRTETAHQRPDATETNVNERGTEGDSGMNKAG